MSQKLLRNTVDELIDVLDNLYPDRCPSVNDTERQIWMRAGNREVVNFLRHKQKEVEEEGSVIALSQSNEVETFCVDGVENVRMNFGMSE